MKLFKQFFGIIAIISLIFAFTACDFLFGDEDKKDNNDNEVKIIVEPLLKTKWSQGSPYNTKLRELAGTEVGDINDLTINICGIVGWTQIMRYHKHPAQGVGQNEAWIHNNGKNLPPVNFEVNFDWDNMLYTYTSSATKQQRNYVAELYYIISIGRVDGNLPKTVNNFGFDKSIQRLDRVYYDDATWEKILKEQLDAGLPVGYQGRGNANHFFVIDGYDNAGKFHVNWGWGGNHDGWYFINNLNPSNYLFNDYNRHHMIINFMPDKGGTSSGYKLALRDFSVNKTSVAQNELFTVSTQVSNISSLDTFQGGRWGVALVDINDNIITIIGNWSIQALTTSWSTLVMSRDISVPENVSLGHYRLKIAVIATDEDWNIITLSRIGDGVPNSIPLEVR